MGCRTLLLAMSLIHLSALTATAKLVACVGDSITYGARIDDRLNDSYPAQLQRILQQSDPAWQVNNYGANGTNLLTKGDDPYVNQSAYRSATRSNADVVVIALGTNDTRRQNWVFKDDFISDYCALIDAFRNLPSQPQVWICKPVPLFHEGVPIYPTVLQDELLPMIDEVGKRKNAPVIDLYTPLVNRRDLFPDGLHPNAEGAGIMAQTVASYLLDERIVPDFNYDGILNLMDFAVLAQQWLEHEPSLDIAPSPGDGVVSYPDLSGLGKRWMERPGLIAHWQLDETQGSVAADQLGHFEGTVHGSPVWRPQEGRIRGALEFDGTDDYVSTAKVLNPADGPFTVFTWIKSVQPGRAILSQSDESGASIIWLGTDAATGALTTTLTDGGPSTGPLASLMRVLDGAWHEIRLVWDGSYRYLYVDGRQAAMDKEKLGKLKPSTNGLFIGAAGDLDSARFWSGEIDDIRIYNRAVKP